jgi:flagellar biosynthesis protein FlhA
MPDNLLKRRLPDLLMGVSLFIILSILIVPVPTPILDLLLVLSIGSAVLVLILTTQIQDALQMSSFPSLLLILTLFRLALNVATTRQILLQGFGGHVVQSFGEFVVGGNYVVGVVIFLVLVTINFMVITKGAGRIAEVAARFTLDAMPGKQMSIDADLNAGLITEKEALTRRERLSQEAEFYGAMDGASKFVRGDAIAGIIITAVNIVGGFAVGVMQQGMSAGQALATFTILTVGDGLVSQIPALVISTAAGMLVTRISTNASIGADVGGQLFLRPRPLLMTGGILGLIALVPGLPFLPFALLGAAIGGTGLLVSKNKGKEAEPAEKEALPAARGRGKQVAGKESAGALPPGEAKLVPEVSPLDLDIGFGLVPLVDQKRGGKLIDRIGQVRAQIAEELGFLLPPVNVRDDMSLKNNQYAIKVRGVRMADGHVRPGSLLAINPGGAEPMEGVPPVREPAFGFEAYWISEGLKDAAEAKGMTAVDCTSVITTHLAEQSKIHAWRMLTRQNVSAMIDRVKETQASVVEELIPAKMSIGGVHRVLAGLLKERAPIRDLGLILETLADNAHRTQDTAVLVELCRRALGSQITQQRIAADGALPAIGLQPQVESTLTSSIRADAGTLGMLTLEPTLARRVVDGLIEAVKMARDEGVEPVLLCAPGLRPHLRELISHDLPAVSVLSFLEVPDAVNVKVVGMAALASADKDALAA